MSRRFKTSRSLILLSALTAAFGSAAVRPAHAAAYSYPTRQRTVNAGVLFVGTASTTVANAPDPAPYVFYVLDQRADIKPVGWTFVNPIAPTSFTAAINNRWGAAYTTAPAPTSVSPSLAAYWEVPLRDTSSDQLQQFDVLYLPATGASFSPADNEKLRRFVDGGGQLIVEYTNTGGSPSLFTGTVWTTGSDLSLTPPAFGTAFDLEPILTQPFLFAQTDLNTLVSATPTTSAGFLSGSTNSDYGNLFGTIVSHTSGAAVTAAQLGAGQIVASTLSIGPVASVTTNAQFSTPTLPNSPAVAPNVTLQLLSNMISWEDAHPTENKTSHQNGAGASAASFAPSFSYPDPAAKTPLTGSIAPAGAAVWGNFIYVTDSTGVLHCFDAYPDKDLLGESKLDNGVQDFSLGKPYDEIWKTPASLGICTSAPTVATFQGITYVLVETADGSVLRFNSITGASAGTYATKITSGAKYPQASIVTTPAPTYYEGRIYAGQPDGTLLVYDLNGGSASSGAVVPLDTNSQNNQNSEYVTAAPAVGLIASGDANTVVATVATNVNLYTVLLGGRNDPLLSYSVNGQLLGYNVNRTSRYFLPNLFVDIASVPPPTAFDGSGNNSVAAGSGQDPVFPLSTNGDYFANWDIDFVLSLASGSNSTLTLNEVKALSLQSTTSAQTMSAPAFGRSGDCYYTVDSGTGLSYLFGVHPDIQQRNVRVKFRFRIPTTGDGALYTNPNGNAPWNYKDSDQVDYTPLENFHFVGAPVVDGQGNVYVAAQNGTQAAVLCFNGSQEPTADAPNGYDTTQASYSQPDEGSSGQTNPIIAIPTTNVAAARFGQLSASGTHISVFNFGRIGKQILNNLTEPQPFLTTPNGNQTGPTAVAQNLQFHTNLAWMTAPFKVNGPVSGLSKVGNTLMLVETGGAFTILDKLPANPTVGTGKIATVTISQIPLGTGPGGVNLNLGTVVAAPSAGGGAMVVNGTAGIAAFNQQLTLIADNNRILEADADGNAVWAVDATTRDTSTGTTTKVDFAHPTALTQVTPNDYLVADTGNNRCVRFDRAGKVIWELTRFNDPQGLMGAGQPNTLSQPTSVEIAPVIQTFNYTDPVSGNPAVGKIKQYLVADSGNNRIVEVTDTTDPNGNILTIKGNAVVTSGTPGGIYQDHILTWVSHTADQYGRRYHYTSASYFYIGTAPALATQIAAIVTNTRLAPLTAAGALSAANGDTSGGSIVTFNRPIVPLAFNMATPNTDLNYVATSFQVGTAPNIKTFQVRNPRFLNVFTPPYPAATIPYSFLYADDNGAFDLAYNSATKSLASTGLAFTPFDYKNMTTVPTTSLPANSAPFPARNLIPFVPTCVQRINDDNSFQPRYLITQSFGMSELGGPPIPFANPATQAPRIGGEIFEVDVDQSVSPAVPTIVGGFGPGATLSRPGGTSPLTQPTSAIRTQQ